VGFKDGVGKERGDGECVYVCIGGGGVFETERARGRDRPLKHLKGFCKLLRGEASIVVHTAEISNLLDAFCVYNESGQLLADFVVETPVW